ncbi:hypothetical protein AAFF_G00329420 [Aldrovandia affinis]|uniref:Uncharacterized protein n=1 Tax=Aldrovandia affinis TaxID=143900 RepID=A0AAD7SNW4_9TELE|nr:hypothetical protein AAFF_G00329420 [Aldrovandia affinis]
MGQQVRDGATRRVLSGEIVTVATETPFADRLRMSHLHRAGPDPDQTLPKSRYCTSLLTAGSLPAIAICGPGDRRTPGGYSSLGRSRCLFSRRSAQCLSTGVVFSRGPTGHTSRSDFFNPLSLCTPPSRLSIPYGVERARLHRNGAPIMRPQPEQWYRISIDRTPRKRTDRRSPQSLLLDSQPAVSLTRTLKWKMIEIHN